MKSRGFKSPGLKLLVEMSCNNYIILVFYFTADFPKVFQQNGEGRIVNGFDTEKALPYQLSIMVVTGLFKKSHNCGATLLTSKYAISALHCFIIWDKSKPNAPGKVARLKDFRIVAGRYYMQKGFITQFGEQVSKKFKRASISKPPVY